MKPILFKTDDVKAILDGSKTVARMVCEEITNYDFKWPLDKKPYFKENKWFYDLQTKVDDDSTHELKPKYQVGDILYVRETWGDYSEHQDGGIGYFLYRADYPQGAKDYKYGVEDGEEILCDLPKWKPSIHMPKEAARIFLKVTDVRVEKLQEISAEQALKEGIDHDSGEDELLCGYCDVDDDQRGVRNYGGGPVFCVDSGECDNARANFEEDCIYTFVDKWDSRIKRRDRKEKGWIGNPYVFVYSFKMCEKPC